MVTIDSDNEALAERPREAVAACLERVIDRLYFSTRDTGSVIDANGNTVGTWTLGDVDPDKKS